MLPQIHSDRRVWINDNSAIWKGKIYVLHLMLFDVLFTKVTFLVSIFKVSRKIYFYWYCFTCTIFSVLLIHRITEKEFLKEKVQILSVKDTLWTLKGLPLNMSILYLAHILFCWKSTTLKLKIWSKDVNHPTNLVSISKTINKLPMGLAVKLD